MDNIGNMLMQHGWEIAFDEFHIDLSAPPSCQTDRLKEDLLQAVRDNYLIDVGWYPGGDSSGRLVIRLIKDFYWQDPLLKLEASDHTELKERLNDILAAAEADRN